MRTSFVAQLISFTTLNSASVARTFYDKITLFYVKKYYRRSSHSVSGIYTSLLSHSVPFFFLKRHYAWTSCTQFSFQLADMFDATSTTYNLDKIVEVFQSIFVTKSFRHIENIWEHFWKHCKYIKCRWRNPRFSQWASLYTL